MLYRLLHAYTPESLTQLVSAMLKDGWKLYGSPSVAITAPSSTEIEHEYVQAVTWEDARNV